MTATQVVDAGAAPRRTSMEGSLNILGMQRSCAANVPARHKAAVPSLEAIRASPHYPVVCTPNPSISGNATYNGSTDLTQAMPINGEMIEFENDLWKGFIYVHLKGLPTTNKQLFEGKKRFTWGFSQGRFKKAIKAKNICLGQEIEVRLKGPGEAVAQFLATQLAHNFSHTCEVNLNCEHPYFLNPLLAACQLVNVSRPGEEPKEVYSAVEDCRLLHPDLVGPNGQPLPADQRRKWCDTPANMEDLDLSPDYVYTFQWWQHLIDLSTYRVHVGPFVAFDMCPILCASPMQLLIKDTGSNTPLLNLLIWHERLLYPDEAGKFSKRKAGEQEQGDRTTMGQLSDRFKGLLANWRT